MRHGQKILKVVVLSAILGMTAFFAGCGSNAVTPVVALADAPQPTPTPLSTITVRGVVESAQSRSVYSHLGFDVERVYVEIGDTVAAGQRLAVLDAERLKLAIAQQRIAISQAQESSQRLVDDTQRMLDTASVNLANNTNMHIVSAQAALEAAEVGLTVARRDLEMAQQDHDEGSSMHILNTESALASARTDLATLEDSHGRLQIMYDAGFLSREELRQSENMLAAAQSRYNDALAHFENAEESQRRMLELSQTALQSAAVAHQSAQTLLNATRNAAQQEVDTLRSAALNAEVAANLEHMELALQQLELDLQDATITAPIDGTVTAVVAREGAPALGLMFVIEDMEDLRIITGFREYDLSRIYEGMEVAITTDATGDAVHSGIISRINPAAIPGLPIVEFEAEILIVSANAGLRIGMNARIDINLEK